MRGAGVSPAAAGGGFAGCGQRGFRAVRGAGVSPVATGDQRLCLWTPRFFEKNRVKLLYGWGFIWIWCGAAESVRQRTQSMLRIVAVRGPSAPQPRRGIGTWGTGSPECAGHRHPTPHGGTRRCRPTFPDGLPTWFVGRDRCVPPPVRTENHMTGWFVPTP